MHCRYNVPSPQAYRVGDHGEEQRVEVRLCDWPDQHPERFVNAPRWLLQQIGSGLMIRPEHDCVSCPGWRAE